ncbi:heavy metal translocating P-type ATPase [Enterococcus sp. CWB-B31]|uniref:heavy metal translocating P-type ATPase n=1 Tax=Enterococcus sp. CWB-B31 TaxID=2885159 RepID=UPI001E37FD53|nr:heavy metal translocating P-type ATPase [Enterococcus sp. CWB-B31]MCB5953549.1 heavy metal translocating P-type ATPase [Enterococcus sp. CWB-B31]
MEHTHTEIHEHNHNCGHNHGHGNTSTILFFAGLITYLAAFAIKEDSFLQILLYIFSMIAAGQHVIMEGFGDTIKDTIAKKRFTPNVHILMTLAALGASVIGDFDEGALLILIFSGAHFLEDYAEGKSKREITNLLKMNPTEARLIQEDGSTKLVAVSTLQIGDQLQVLNGDQVPTDGVILSGTGVIDEASINGESIPKEKTIGDTVFGSTINGTSSFTMEVTKDSKDTVFAKILKLVEQSQSNLSKTATKIKLLEPKYVTAVLIIVPLFILAAPFLLGWSWELSFYRGMVLLISASPCALAASAVPATLAGISNLAKRGVLFKGGTFLSNLADIRAVAFDKTGTLTEGKPVVTDYYFHTDDKKAKAKWLKVLSSMEKEANHPLANAILAKFPPVDAIKMAVTNEIGKGLLAHYDNKSYRLGKPDLFEQVPPIIHRKEEMLSESGKTVIYFSENDSVVGLIAMMAIPNPKAKEVISYLKEQNIHTTMITGDAEKTGQAVAKVLGIDEVAGNVLPENKSTIVKEHQKKFGMTAMLGDGVNDAPALVTADIGFAMGDGTDIAIDVADAVLMNNDLQKFSYAHKVSKRLNKIVWQNIIFSMTVVALLVALNLLGKMDIAIGVIAHEGSTLIVILNGLRLLLPVKN